MQRIFAFLIAAVAAVGLAFAQAPAPKDAKKADAPKAGTTQSADAKKSDAKKVELIDINSATEAQLASLTGIGEARAKAIIKGRPYKGKDELLAKKIVPANVYKDIQAKIIAKQK